MVQTKQEASLRSPVLFFPGEGVLVHVSSFGAEWTKKEVTRRITSLV